MTTQDALKFLEDQVAHPTEGLPEEIFYFITRLTPMLNIDLLVQDSEGRSLLAWRDDQFSGTGWHIPGGIVRFKESLQTRINKVAMSEIGTEVQVNPTPLACNEIMGTRRTRGHFISLLYRGKLSNTYAPRNEGLKPYQAGYLAWHDSAPNDLIPVHNIYRPYIDGKL